MRTICYRCLVFGGLMSSLNWLITLVLCLRQTPFDGIVEYKSIEDIYDFIISELKDAAGKIDVNADMSAITSEKTDAFYDGDASKWIKYANSLRLRYAMRLSAVDQAKAKAAFEDAASTNNFITTQDEIAQVQEKGDGLILMV